MSILAEYGTVSLYFLLQTKCLMEEVHQEDLVQDELILI